MRRHGGAMTWTLDWPSFWFGTSAGCVVMLLMLALVRLVVEYDWRRAR